MERKYNAEIIDPDDGNIIAYDNDTPIVAKNPWSGVIVEITKTDIQPGDADRYGILMDDDIREHLHQELAPCSDWDFLRAWSELVTIDEVGRVIIGS